MPTAFRTILPLFGAEVRRDIDKTGKTVIAGHFVTASPFYKGLAHVKLLDKRSQDEYPYSGELPISIILGRSSSGTHGRKINERAASSERRGRFLRRKWHVH